MLNKLPTELFLEIVERISIKDIIALRSTSRVLKEKVDGIGNYVITAEVKKHNLSMDWISRFEWHLHELIRCWKLNLLNVHHIDIPNLKKDILFHFIKHRTISNYPNKYNLYTAFVLTHIEFLDYTRFHDHHLFLQQFDHATYIDALRVHYYKPILLAHAPHPHINFSNYTVGDISYLRLDTLHELSEYITTIPLLCRLVGVKQLSLERAQLLECCEFCYNADLTSLVVYRYNRQDDDLLGYNYNQIKQFLKRMCPSKYAVIHQYELTLINRLITYTNPMTSKRLRLGTRASNRFMHHLLFETTHSPMHRQVYHSLYSYIIRRQHQLLQQYFS